MNMCNLTVTFRDQKVAVANALADLGLNLLSSAVVTIDRNEILRGYAMIAKMKAIKANNQNVLDLLHFVNLVEAA
jgi:hypothetical protein